MYSLSGKSVAPKVVSRTLRRRLMNDLKEITKRPVPGANAMPISEDNFAIWKAVVTGLKGSPAEGVKVYFCLEFPAEYPAKPPFAYFITPIRNKEGVTETDPHGRIVICNSLFGNFYKYHGDWSAGSQAGWCPSYTTSTILVYMLDMISNPGMLCLDEETIKKMKEAKIPEKYLMPIPGFVETTKEPEKSKKSSDSSKTSETDLKTEDDVPLEAMVADRPKETDSKTEDETDKKDTEEMDREQLLLTYPHCFSLHETCKEDLLGLCLTKQFVPFVGEYLSKTGIDHGIKTSATDHLYAYWLPVFQDESIWMSHREKLHEYLAVALGTYNNDEGRMIKDQYLLLVKLYYYVLQQFTSTLPTMKTISPPVIETLMVLIRTIRRLIEETGTDGFTNDEALVFLTTDYETVSSAYMRKDARHYLFHGICNFLFSTEADWIDMEIKVGILVCEWNSAEYEEPVKPKMTQDMKYYEFQEKMKRYNELMANKEPISEVQLFKLINLLRYIRNYPNEYIDQTYGRPKGDTLVEVMEIVT